MNLFIEKTPRHVNRKISVHAKNRAKHLEVLEGLKPRRQGAQILSNEARFSGRRNKLAGGEGRERMRRNAASGLFTKPSFFRRKNTGIPRAASSGSPGIWRLTSQNGTILARSTFYNILNNPFYYGKYEWPNGSGNWFHGLHECVITKEEFDVVQRMLGKLGKPIAHNHSFYLTGLFRCKECGCAITATKKIKHYQETSRTVTYTYYHCTRKNKAIKCNFKPLTEENLFRDINEFLLTVKPDIEFIKWAKKWLAIVHKDQSENQETVLKSQQRALEDTERRLNKLLDMRLNDMLDDSAYKIKKSQLEKEKRDISEMLANVEKGLDAWRVKVENTLDFAYACQQKFASGTRDDKHEIMMLLSLHDLYGSPAWIRTTNLEVNSFLLYR